MNTYTICRHEQRHDIERAFARGVAFRTIANQFNAGESSLKRHQQCIAEALLTARKERNYQTARDVDAELEKAFRFVDKVTSACDRWLQDPNNPEEYTLEPRAGDIDVIYKEQAGSNADGKPIYKNKRAVLSELLAKVEGNDYLIQHTEATYTDPRKLMLDAMSKLHSSIDQLAKLTGAYQKKQENQHDKRRKRYILIEALSLIHQSQGTPKTRDEIEDEIDESLRAVDAVWAQAEQQAIEKGYIN